MPTLWKVVIFPFIKEGKAPYQSPPPDGFPAVSFFANHQSDLRKQPAEHSSPYPSNGIIIIKEIRMKSNECMIEQKVYAQGSQVCDDKLCYVCKDGIWQEKGALDFVIGGP
jgi:hypothetical protein